MMVKIYRVKRMKYNAQVFREEDHPRAADGKFGKGGGSRIRESKNITKLKSIGAIQKNIKTKLEKMGYEVEESQSGLSDSGYITAKIKDKEYKIRVSDHDLPPSYDKTHGQYDFDIKGGGKDRPGTQGTAEEYQYLIARMAKIAGKDIPEQEKRIIEDDKKEFEKKRKSEEQQAQKRIIKIKSLEEREEKKKRLIETDGYAKEKIKELESEAEKYTGDKRKKKLKKLKEFIDEYEPTENASPRKFIYCP